MAYVDCSQRLESFSEILVMQFHGHHSYFRSDIQMLLAVKEGEI